MGAQKQIRADGYFENLSDAIKELVKDACVNAMNENSDFYPSAREGVEDIECHSRDGFTPFDHNRGGIEIRTYNDLFGIFGSGSFPANKKAAADIQRQIDLSFDYLAQDTFEKFEKLLVSHGLTVKDCYYHTIREFNENNSNVLVEVQDYVENGESESIMGSENGIAYEVRFLYHGKVDGIHSASVSCAVNTEGPYHRSAYSFGKEIEITWLTFKELERKLKTALEETSKATF